MSNNPIVYKYPLDLEGTSTDNRVEGEIHNITDDNRVILTKEGPFFTDSFTISHPTITLTKGIDYSFYALVSEASKITNKEVCGGFIILNPKVTGDITINYNVIGGKYREQLEVIQQLKQTYAIHKKPTLWEDVLNIPKVFHPAHHLHHMNDVTGLGPIVQYLAIIVDEFRNTRKLRNTELWKRVGLIYTRTNDFIDTFQTRLDEVTNVARELNERFTGDNTPVSQSTFNTLQTRLNTNIQRIDGLIETNKSSISSINDSIATINNTALRNRNELQSSIDQLKSKVDRLNITLSYTGNRADGQFITLNKNDSTWEISYGDDPLLISLSSRVDTLSNTINGLSSTLSTTTDNHNSLSSEFTEFKNLVDGKLATLTNKDSELSSTLLEVRNEVTRNKSELNDLITTQIGRIDGVLSNVNDSVIERVIPIITEKVTESISSLDGVRTQLDGLVGTTNKLSQRLTTVNDRIDSVNSETMNSVSVLFQDFKRDNVDTLRSSLTSLVNSTSSTITTRLSQLESRLSEQSSLLGTKETEIKEWTTNEIEVKARTPLSSLTNTVNSINRKVSKNENDIRDINSTQVSLSNAITENKRTLETLINTSKQEVLTNLKQQINKYKGDIVDSDNYHIVGLESRPYDTPNNVGGDPIGKMATVTLSDKVIYPLGEDACLPYLKDEYYELSVISRLNTFSSKIGIGVECLDVNKNPITLTNVVVDRTKTGVTTTNLSGPGSISIERSDFTFDGETIIHFYPSGTSNFVDPYITFIGRVVKTNDRLTLHSTGKFYLRGVQQPSVNITRGMVYVFGEIKAEKYIKLKEVAVSDVGENIWNKVSGILKSGWFSSQDISTSTSDGVPYRNTVYIRPVLFVNEALTSTTDSVSFGNVVVRRIEKPIELNNLPGLKNYLNSWLDTRIRESQMGNAPNASPWDLSRFRIQPGAESFSSVTVDDNNNLNITGLVAYDVNGTGPRSLYAPTSTFNITESQEWIVPDSFDGRLALITVRASASVVSGNMNISAVRQTYTKLVGGTRVSIRVGEISSFGSILTVSNAVDYPDAIYPRLTIPAGTTNVNAPSGLVTIVV